MLSVFMTVLTMAVDVCQISTGLFLSVGHCLASTGK